MRQVTHFNVRPLRASVSGYRLYECPIGRTLEVERGSDRPFSLASLVLRGQVLEELSLLQLWSFQLSSESLSPSSESFPTISYYDMYDRWTTQTFLPASHVGVSQIRRRPDAKPGYYGNAVPIIALNARVAQANESVARGRRCAPFARPIRSTAMKPSSRAPGSERCDRRTLIRFCVRPKPRRGYSLFS